MEGWEEPLRGHNAKSTLCTQWPIIMEVVSTHKRTYFYRILRQFTFTIYCSIISPFTPTSRNGLFTRVSSYNSYVAGFTYHLTNPNEVYKKKRTRPFHCHDTASNSEFVQSVWTVKTGMQDTVARPFIGFVLLWRCNPTRVMASSFLRFLDHTRRTTVGTTPLDEWSACRRDLYLTTHNTHNRKTSMPPVGFEPTISAGERPQTYALDHAATGTGFIRP